MATARSAFVVSVLLLLSGADAFAKKDKDAGKGKKDTTIVMTGIEAFDEVFVHVQEIDARLNSAESALHTARTSLNSALDLKRGTPLKTAITELKERGQGQLGLAIDNKAVPKLTVSDAVPTNVQSAVDAVNLLTSSLATSITDLATLPGEVSQVVKQSKSMPARLKDEFKNTDGAGLASMLFSFPKTSKALTGNLKVTSALPSRSERVVGRMNDIMGVVKTEFPVKAPGQGGGSSADPASRHPSSGGR